MEQSGTIPRGLLDFSEWAGLYRRPGPLATVCVATPAAVENASYRNRLRWEEMRRGLEAGGAPSAVTEAVGEVVGDAHRHGQGLAVYADEGGVLSAEHSPVPPRAELARWDSLPSLGTVLDWRQHQPPYVVALVDHTGADLLASGSGIADRDEQVDDSNRYPVARNAPGGWSQRHYQQHAVDNWAKSARQVAETLTAMVERVEPEIVLVGGDPRSCELLLADLPGPVADRVERVPGSRAADGGGDHTAHQVARLVETVAARRTVEILEEFRMHLGRGDRAVEGVEATLAALREGRVAALLVHDDPGDDRRASFGAEPHLVAAGPIAIDGVGGGPVGDGRLVDAALRAAAGTGARVRLVPGAGGPEGGLGALLRWP